VQKEFIIQVEIPMLVEMWVIHLLNVQGK